MLATDWDDHTSSMAITIYQFEHSPYCIPITQVLTALGREFTARNTANGNRREIIELTGGGAYTVPVLQDGEQVIYETEAEPQAIPRYIDAQYAGGCLFPARLEGFQALMIPYVEDQVEGVTFKLTDPHYLASVSDPVERTMILRHKERKFGPGCEERWLAQREELAAEAARLLAPFDQMLAHTPWLLGGEPVYLDFLLYGILGNLTWRGHNGLPPGQENLRDWVARLRDFCFPT